MRQKNVLHAWNKTARGVVTLLVVSNWIKHYTLFATVLKIHDALYSCIITSIQELQDVATTLKLSAIYHYYITI